MGLLDSLRRRERLPEAPSFGPGVAAALTASTPAPAGVTMELTSNGLSATAVDPAAIMAAVAPVSDDGPTNIPKLPGRRATDPRAARATFFARRVGFVHNTYRFLAHQAARPALVLERSLDGGETWDVVEPAEDPWGYGVLRTIKPPTGTVADLIRTAVYLDDTAGEFYLIDVTKDGQTPAFIVRAASAVHPTKKGTYIIKETPDARRADGGGAVYEVPESRVYRHWQPDEEWPLMATSSLIGMVDDLDTLWTLMRQLRRESRSRLAMNNLLWSPSEAHVKTRDVGGQPVSIFNLNYASAATAAINDLDDDNVASVAPLSINTPGASGGAQLQPPKIIEIPSLGPDLLSYIQDARDVVAAGLPLSTQAVFDAQESGNHWADWLADEKDLQTIGERLRRVLDSLTDVILRPALAYGAAAGAWRGGDTGMWRIGYNPDVLRRTLDNSENAKWAWANGLIGDEPALGYLHLKPGDYPDDEDFAKTIDRRKQITAATTPAGAAGGGAPPAGDPAAAGPSSGPALPSGIAKTAPAALPAGGPVPNGGKVPNPEQPAPPAMAASPELDDAAVARYLTAIDDRWLLGGQ